MAKRSNPPRRGLSPGKAVLIGLLSVTLLLVIVMQFGGKKRRVAEPDTQTPTESSELKIASAVTVLKTEVKRSVNYWPSFNVTDVVASNPFMLPEVLRPKQEAAKTLTPSSGQGKDTENMSAIESAEIREMRRRQAEFMASLRAKGVDMILRSHRGSVARIGDLSLRVGDVHEGLRVEAIGQNEVTFAPVVAADGQPD